MWARRPRLPHTRTTSHDHCAQDGRDTIDTCCAPGPDTATVWAYPTPVYTHTEGRCTHNTQNQCHRAVCPSATTCPQRNAIGRHQAGMHPQQRKHIGASPPPGEDTPDRRQIQGKKKGGTSTKGSVLILTCVPLPHLVLPSVSFLGLVVGLVCPRQMVDWPNVFALLWMHSCLVSPDGVTLWTCG